jgi:hypothetical protein
VVNFSTLAFSSPRDFSRARFLSFSRISKSS